MSSPLLVGRQRESALLSGVLADPDGHGGVLLILGDPGIGKSSLLATAGSQARSQGRRVLAVTGVESEASYLFAGLHQLVAPLMPEAWRLPDPARNALLAAFGLSDGPAPDPFLIALAAADLVAVAAGDTPVAVIADDVQWLDPHTQQVLVFLGHRAASARIALVAAMRTGYPGPFLAADFPELSLDGLDDESAARILAHTAPDLTAEERDHIIREAVGNPLALRELPESRREDHGAGAAGARVALPARLEEAFAGRAAGLPAATRDLLLVAAVSSGDDVGEVLAAAGILFGADVSPEDVRPAEAARLVSVGEGRVAFRHPLVRSGLIQAAGLARRHAANAALADVLHADPYRQVRHRAQAIFGPDDTVADQLNDWALVAAGRGALLSAIADLRQAAQLTAEPARRGRRLLDAAEYGFGLGRADIVDELVTAAVRDDLSDLDRARAEWLREIFDDGVPGDAPRVFELCDIAARSHAAQDTNLALNLLLGAALRCWWADTGPEARDRVIATIGLLGPGTDADARHTAALAVGEPVGQCEPVRARLAEAGPRPSPDADTLRMLGMAAHAVGDEAEALKLLRAAEERLRADGRLAPLSQVLSMQVMVLLDLGDLGAAAACAEEGEHLARRTGQPIWRTGTLVCDAIRMAMQGQASAALRTAAEAEVEAGRRRLNDLLSCVQLARGLAWLSCGQARDAYLALRRALDPDDPAYHRRECFGSLMFLADAAVRAGHVADAREVLAALEGIGESVPSPILHAHLAYARAVLADDAEAEPLYLAALTSPETRDWLVVRAKANLAYGTWLRARGRAVEAAGFLAMARAEFDRIGALPWADEARCELARVGRPVVWPGVDEAGYTGVQVRTWDVRALADAGVSRREIAGRLLVTRDVVDLHLGRD